MPNVAYPTLALMLVLIAWEGLTRALGVATYLLPPPSIIGLEMVNEWQLLVHHGVWTWTEVVLGFLTAVFIGIPIAVMIVYSRVFERSAYPLIVGAQTIPKVAIAPLFIIWFGFGLTPKVLIAFLIAFFPIVVASVVGLKSSPLEMLYLVRSMGASEWQTFWRIRFPQALPSIFGGLKVGVTLAVVGAVVGELVASDRGLGYLIQISIAHLNTTILFAAIVGLSLIGVTMFLILDAIERKVLRWHVSQRREQIYASS